ncbi:MAG: hypothetical protein C5B51_11625 [Terriglobia bacterium]|nr:MAG: hypothetical protein C5B51_11625 [Terriglobia bacterium]
MKELASICAAGALFGGVFLLGQTSIPEPRKQFGGSVTGAFEGWFPSGNDARTFLIGYFNRNTQEELDIPIGPNNRIEPGGPDMGQPTHFLPGRRHGVFAIPVPKDFSPQDKFTWTIFANGQYNSIPLRLNRDYLISPFSEIAVNNTPPAIRFEPNGAAVQGPVAMLANAPLRTTALSQPLALTLWVTDDMKYTSGTGAPLTRDRPPVTLLWSKYRGPGAVKFEKASPPAEPSGPADERHGFSGKATTSVMFSEPGDYVLHVTVNDYSGEGGGGFQCCWTTSLVKVSVTP